MVIIRGEWFSPDDTQDPRGISAGPYFRTSSAQQVRLNRMPSVMTPVGTYECRVPLFGSNVEQVASIYIYIS